MDLTFGQPYWPRRGGPPTAYGPLSGDADCDVAVVGAGITGALITDQLTRAGLKVIVLDRRAAGLGSTAASTALLQYEIDTHLTDLAELVGEPHAVRAYRLCLTALDDLAAIADDLPQDVGYRRRESLYFASTPEDLPGLRREYEARRAIGVPLEFWTREQLRERTGIDRAGALYSLAAAEVDPYRFTHALLVSSVARGAVVHDHTAVTDLSRRESRWSLRTSSGGEVRATRVVIAAGYESQRFLSRPLARLYDTYALVSDPLPSGEGWYRDALIWETARPYLYLRRTLDGRVMLGGRDDRHAGRPPSAAQLDAKRRELEVAACELLPFLSFRTAFTWGGTFGVTGDGLGFIGPDPERPGLLFALGYGGNGITYGMIAANILHDVCVGRANPDADVFRLDRPLPKVILR